MLTHDQWVDLNHELESMGTSNVHIVDFKYFQLIQELILIDSLYIILCYCMCVSPHPLKQ